MYKARITTLPHKLSKLVDTKFVVSIFNQAYSMALEETKLNNKKEFGMDEIAPQLEKCLEPILMSVDLTNEVEYLKLSHWVENHTWRQETQSILYKCIAIQGIVSCLLSTIKDKQQKQKIIGKIISIGSDSPDFAEIISFREKIHGTNKGLDITVLNKNDEHKTYTLKVCTTIGNILSEKFSADVAKKMVNIEEPSDFSIKLNIDKEKKSLKDSSINKTLIAPAYLVLQDKNIEVSPKNACRQLRVVSEWSNDLASFKACELFGFEKRMLMAGTFYPELFEDLRILNLHCELGLELIVVVATYLCDFDLHLENFMLKINITGVSEENIEKVKFLIEEFKELIRKRKEQVAAYNNSKTQKDTTKKRQESAEHLEALITAIKILKKLGAEIYFHKIDHDSGFYRYIDRDRKVDFSTHRTPPLHWSNLSILKIKAQPTCHIVELTSATEEGIDQLLLSEKAIVFLQANPLQTHMNTVLQCANALFKDIQVATSKINNLSLKDKQETEHYLLHQFLLHIGEYNAGDHFSSFDYSFMGVLGGLPHDEILEMKIKNTKECIIQSLKIGTIYKVNDLQEQLYQRLIKKEQREEYLSTHQLNFKNFLALQLKQNQMEYLYMIWPDIWKNYCYFFPDYVSRASPMACGGYLMSSQSYNIAIEIHALSDNFSEVGITDKKLEDKMDLRKTVYQKTQDYLKNNSHRRLGKKILASMSNFSTFPNLLELQNNTLEVTPSFVSKGIKKD